MPEENFNERITKSIGKLEAGQEYLGNQLEQQTTRYEAQAEAQAARTQKITEDVSDIKSKVTQMVAHSEWSNKSSAMDITGIHTSLQNLDTRVLVIEKNKNNFDAVWKFICGVAVVLWTIAKIILPYFKGH